jgi:uncharacterized protein (DUF1697 family)
MLELVTRLEKLGLSNIKTYIQSGNVVFQGEKNVELSQKICAAIEKHCGFLVQVIILDIDKLHNAIASNPLAGEAELNALHFFFLSSLPENPDLKALERSRRIASSLSLLRKCFISMHLKE